MTINTSVKFRRLRWPQNLIFFSTFYKKLIFIEHLSPGGDVTDEIRRQIIVTLSTKDSEYLIGFENSFGNMAN